MHPRLTVLSRIFERGAPLEQDLADFAAAGAERIGLSARKLAGHVDVVRQSGLDVTHLGQGPMRESRTVQEAIDLATAVGAPIVYGPAGGDPSLEWEGAAARFVSALEPAARYADARGVRLLIEPTITLLADISMLHTLSDTVDLAERAGIGVCLDIQHCWTERGLHDAIVRGSDLIGLVQLSDWVPGNRHHFRAVPGDGAIPLDRIVGWILETGYDGLFDLEIYPEPGVPEAETLARGLDRAGALLDRLS